MPVQKDVYIGMPMYDNKTEMPIWEAIQHAIHDPENPVAGLIPYNGDSLVSRARNEIVSMFELMPPDKARFLMFIDSDIYFSPNDVKKLRAHNLPVVAGLYFLKNLTATPVLNTKLREKPGGLAHVKEIGTGFLMIRRDTFGALRSSGYAKEYNPGSNQHNLTVKRVEYFPVGVKDDILLSEDYYFSHLCEMVNIPCYVDQTVIVRHKGWCLYPLMPKDLVNALTCALNTFRTNGDQTVTEDAWVELLKAWQNFNHGASSQEVTTSESAKESSFVYEAPALQQSGAPAAPSQTFVVQNNIDRAAIATLVREGNDEISSRGISAPPASAG